jgi:hypothetical protein
MEELVTLETASSAIEKNIVTEPVITTDLTSKEGVN